MQPLGNDRDQLPQGRTIHALLLTYKLSVEAEGKYRVTVPMLNRYGMISCLNLQEMAIRPEVHDCRQG